MEGQEDCVRAVTQGVLMETCLLRPAPTTTTTTTATVDRRSKRGLDGGVGVYRVVSCHVAACVTRDEPVAPRATT